MCRERYLSGCPPSTLPDLSNLPELAEMEQVEAVHLFSERATHRRARFSR